ncbi:MAG: prepilin-type N-terminal cleavage/methylation domain-containing protein [Candidatus Omnitrophota bacterium]|jgi:type IV pilus assembly protein PilE
MKQKKKGFTLIELIIVVVIIALLALIAIPKYSANINKARKAQVWSVLRAIREAEVAYYAVWGAYKTSYPIVVTVDGDQIYNQSAPVFPGSGSYAIDGSGCPSEGLGAYVYITAFAGCYYSVCFTSGNIWQAPACPSV